MKKLLFSQIGIKQALRLVGLGYIVLVLPVCFISYIKLNAVQAAIQEKDQSTTTTYYNEKIEYHHISICHICDVGFVRFYPKGYVVLKDGTDN